MSEQKLKNFIAELIQEVEKELEEATTTANVDGYQTPHAFSRKKDKERTRKNATQLGYELVDDDVDNISEGIIQDREKQLKDLKQGGVVNGGGYGPFKKKGRDTFVSPKGKMYNSAGLIKLIGTFSDFKINESVNEAKVKRPVNRWLELKNDDTMHPHKKMAHGLKELKYQLAETEKFFKWYNKIKTMNELDSTNYWKRTQNHIYKIKERLINIAKTIQEIEK